MNRLSRQVHFCEEDPGIQTAKNIIRQKIRNQRGLLLTRLQSAKRSDRFILERSINHTAARLNKIEMDIGLLNDDIASFQETREKIFLHEARAAQVYWKSCALLIGNPEWKRKPRIRTDYFNNLLDAGYHMLFQKIDNIIRDVGLHPEIGVFHSEATSLPLVYDLPELWRQPVVDVCILNFLRRHRIKKDNQENYIPKICADIKQCMEEKKIRYHGECIRMEWVMRREIISLRRCIEEKQSWKPVKYLWGRSQYCK